MSLQTPIERMAKGPRLAESWISTEVSAPSLPGGDCQGNSVELQRDRRRHGCVRRNLRRRFHPRRAKRQREAGATGLEPGIPVAKEELIRTSNVRKLFSRDRRTCWGRDRVPARQTEINRTTPRCWTSEPSVIRHDVTRQLARSCGARFAALSRHVGTADAAPQAQDGTEKDPGSEAHRKRMVEMGNEKRKGRWSAPTRSFPSSRTKRSRRPALSSQGRDVEVGATRRSW